jgi:predicted NBD/HSP70 family sugar kinase
VKSPEQGGVAIVRQLNALAIWRALRDADALTGTELMAATGLSRPTVHAVCEELISRGLVAEIETRPPEGAARAGRPARQYTCNSEAGHLIAIDLGAKKVSVVLGDLRGRSVAEHTTVFPDERVLATERMDAVRGAVQSVLTDRGIAATNIVCAVMGVPSPVDDHGHVAAADHYLPGLHRLDLRAELQEELGLSTIVENDANLAVIGERWRGVAQEIDDVVELLAGYRLGAGIVLGGRLLRGSRGAAGELTFLSMVQGVGNTDAVAELAELFALHAENQGLIDAGSPMSRPGSSSGRPSAELVFEAVRSGDPVATAILEMVIERMARVIAIIATFLNPELVVIGGGVAAAGDLLLPGLTAALPSLTDFPPRLQVSSLGDRAVTTGAIRIALEQMEERFFGAGSTVTTREGLVTADGRM